MESNDLFVDRLDAGRRLVPLLEGFRSESPLVLGLPRGGVAVAYEVAKALNAPLDVWVVRKIGAPGNPELGIGAVAEGGEVYVDDWAARSVGATGRFLHLESQKKLREVDERVRLFRGDRAPPDVTGRTVLLVDDGLAMGVTAMAAARAVRKRRPRRLILAVPIGAPEGMDRLRSVVDGVACVREEPMLGSIGLWYRDFEQVEDDEVLKYLARQRQSLPSAKRPATKGAPGAQGSAKVPTQPLGVVEEQSVTIPVQGGVLEGDLKIPRGAPGIVLFAHGSGSGRKSPRNRAVATALQQRGLATLLFDLLTPEEGQEDEIQGVYRFDIPFLARRLRAVTDWVRARKETREMAIGYFGASTGAAAALVAAAESSEGVKAIVSRGGRPDLAGDPLERVRVPSLFIVGGADGEVLGLHRDVLPRVPAVKRLLVVPGATHLFEEPGALEEVAHLAGDWFETYLAPRPRAGQGAQARL